VYRDEILIGQAVAKANAEAEKRRPDFEQRLASIGAEITRAERALERYYEAFEQGTLSPRSCRATGSSRRRFANVRTSGAYRDRTGELRLANPTDSPTPPDADGRNRHH
jgi:hypothetical protein